MKTFPWIAVGVGAGLTTYLLLERFTPGYAAVGSDIDNASGKMSLWGWKTRLKGKGTSLVGALKERAVQALENGQLVAEGLGDRAFGEAENIAGHVSETIGGKLHTVNHLQ
jgi:uncharacterized protein YjbJ (UPF0337 family)